MLPRCWRLSSASRASRTRWVFVGHKGNPPALAAGAAEREVGRAQATGAASGLGGLRQPVDVRSRGLQPGAVVERPCRHDGAADRTLDASGQHQRGGLNALEGYASGLPVAADLLGVGRDRPAIHLHGEVSSSGTPFCSASASSSLRTSSYHSQCAITKTGPMSGIGSMHRKIAGSVRA